MDAYITGEASLPNGTYDAPERDLVLRVVLDALETADHNPTEVDGLYLPKPRPWTDQGFFSTLLAARLGAAPARTMEVYTGGTSGSNAFHSAIADVRAGRVETAVVAAVERNSTIETEDYFEYILGIFDREFQSPAGPSIPAVYAQSMQRYCHDFDVDRESLAGIAAKNRTNGAENHGSLFSEPVTTEEVTNSRPIADPLCLYECPAPCDGAAAMVVTSEPTGEASPIRVGGIGSGHASSHLVGTREGSLSQLPAVGTATEAAFGDADTTASEIDVFEPYAPFPHVEAIITEEISLFDRGAGAAAFERGETAIDGAYPVSPSGGCIGRGHPAMVTPLLNVIAGARQIRGTAANQVADTGRVLTTTEHGHVDGVTATVLEATA
jgi:acetyl-CoA acetyltransferase